MKISNIELKNYRAFYATHTIDTNNKNLLIYGENGSGKSSLYQSIVDFFAVVEKDLTKLPFNKNHWNRLSTTPDEEIIKITFDDNTSAEFTPTLATPQSANADFLRVAKQNPFYTYKRILKTYIADKSVEQQMLLLLVKEILATYVDAKGKSILDYWNILENLTKIKGKIPPNMIDYQEDMEVFSVSLQTAVNKLVKQLNDFLDKYFHTNIHLTITTPNFTNTHTNIKDIKNTAKELLEKATVQIKVKFFDKEIDNHTEFLNEARLSALAICMYLASLKVTPAPQKLKILFLDDIFIGLDMSNRLPLLEILKTEFLDYQIFMTTYDRAWFEVAKQWFDNKAKGNWKFFEMYVDDFTNKFDVPIILETKTHIEKAEYYLAKHDYAACGVFLRKECEKVLKKLLPPLMTKELKKDDSNNCKENDKSLNDLILIFKEFCQYVNLDFTPFEDLSIYKHSLLNPLSHNDMTLPIFKAELVTALNVLKELNKVEKVEIKEIPKTKGQSAILNLQDGISAELHITESISIFSQNSTMKLLSKCKVQLKNIRNTANNDTSKNQEFASLQKLYEFLCNEFSIECNLVELPQKISFNKGEGQPRKTLQQLIDALL